MCKALCRLKIFSLSAQVVVLPCVQFFPVCGNTVAHWIYCCWWDWIICITPQDRMPRTNPWSLILQDTEGSWCPARDGMGMGLQPAAGQHLGVHWVWFWWRYLFFPLQQGGIHHHSWVWDSEQQTWGRWTEKDRKTWVVLAQVCVHASVFGGGTGGHWYRSL